MATHEKQIDIHKIKLAVSISKGAFIGVYGNYDITDARKLYLQILNELQEAIKNDNIEHFKILCKAIDYIHDIETYANISYFYENILNPIKSTNLVILVCKHNKIRFLKHLFDNKREILKGLIISIGQIIIFPHHEDEAGHNAFYYAIRSGNIKLLDGLIKWVEDFPKEMQSEVLNENISKAYEELKLKNILLAEEMEIFVQSKLVDFNFFSDSNSQNQSVKNINNVRGRIELVLETITALIKEYSNVQVDEKFLFMAKFIVKNIHVLKRLLKSTYDRLPWEEIEFCLVSYISSHTKQQEINLFYHVFLDKDKILKYLEFFSKKLQEVKDMIGRVSAKKLFVLPKLNREKVQAKIIIRTPQFKELYENYRQIRDVHSLQKMHYHINLASFAFPKEKEGQLIILRVLQVMGENLKNTLESPKLSTTTSELLLHSLPLNTRKVITDLRNSLSHADSLSKRTEIEANADENYFIGIQKDVKSVGEVIFEIYFSYKIKMVRILLKRIVDSENSNEIKEIVKTLENAKLDEMNFKFSKLMKYESLEKIIKELSDNISDKTMFEEKLLNEIYDILSNEKNKSENISSNYTIAFATLNSFKMFLSDNAFDHNAVRITKFCANKVLEYTASEIDPQNLKMIAKLSLSIFSNYSFRILNGRGLKMQYGLKMKLDEMTKLMHKLFHIAEFGSGDIEYVKKLRDMLNAINLPDCTNKQSSISAEKLNFLLELKLDDLKNILTNNSFGDQLIDELPSYKSRKKLQLGVEMLVLDLMSILESLKSKLVENLFFLDENAPSLTGKSLRNHLAHDNAVIDILLPDPSIAIILNAKKLAEVNILESKQKIGKLICYNVFQQRIKYNVGFVNIKNQDEFFCALREGNLKTAEDSFKKGADIRARNNNLWSALHFAAMGPNLEVVKFILNEDSDISVKDINGRNPLHVAAAHGRKATVEYFVEKTQLYVDDVDNNGRTSLHIAAQNGHKDTVEILLKNKANVAAQDLCGLSPLHYAIINNHTNIAKILLNKDANVDINEAMGGFTPLQIAAESGNVDLVNFLLQNKADITASSDSDFTSLHAAALNGYLDVVNIFILKGANVNARVIDGCTPLHYAVEKCHPDIVEILLKHGAEVNIVDKTFFNAPIHYAAHSGFTRIVKTLLEYNADVNLATNNGFTSLHLATLGGHLEIVNILLNHEVNINSQDKNNNTPLHFAALHGHTELAELLLKNGAEVNACSNDNLTPLYMAAMNGHDDVVNTLIKYKANVKVRDSEGRTALHAAAVSGKKDVIDVLIKNKVEVNAKTSRGITPLHEAALHGLPEAVVILIENKAEINARDYSSITPLHAAIVTGYKDVVNILIKHKAEINGIISENYTPLHIAVKFGHKEITEILVKNGANVNTGGCTPLCHAVMHNYEEIVKILIANGADVNAESAYLGNVTSNPHVCQSSELAIKDQYAFGQISHLEIESLLSTAILPLAVACHFGYTNIVKILLKQKARVNIKCVENVTPLHIAAMKGHDQIARILIERGAAIDALTVHEVSPLYIAAQAGYEQIVKMLIKNGAYVNIQSYEGVTPLHIAAVKGHSNVIKVLLNSEANAKLKDRKDRTTLEQGVAYGNLQVVKMLLQYEKENINAKGNNGLTLLHIAAQENNLEIVKYLVNEGSDIHAENLFGSKPIHIAAREGFKDAVEFFLKMGSSVNELGFANQTILHYATQNAQAEVVKYLITQGANVNAKDKDGKSPLYFAIKYSRKNIIEILLENGAVYDDVDKINIKPFLHKAVVKSLVSSEKLFEVVRRNNFLETQSLIKEGAVVNVKNCDEETPLHYAAWKGNDKIVKFLLQNRANPNAETNKKHTPLHYASKYSHLNIVIILLGNGAVYNATSVSGKTPSDFTAEKSINSLFKLVNESFQNVKSGNSKVIDDLNKIKDIPTVRAIMNAHNEDRQILIVAALNYNFPKVEDLKQVLQEDVSVKIKDGLDLLNQGNCQKALSIFVEILEKRKKILGADNPGTLDIELHIVKVLYKLGSYQQTLNTLEHIYLKQKVILGESNAITLSTRSAIATMLQRHGYDEEASIIFQEIYKKRKQILGPNHTKTLNTLFDMASVFNSLGNYEEALHINKYVLKKRKEMLGENNLDTICVQNNIAMTLANQNENKQALKIYRDVFERKKEVLGINHSDTLQTLESIAGILLRQKNYSEALKVYEEILYIQKDTLHTNHPDILLTQCNIVNLLFIQGKCVKALKTYRKISDQVRIAFEPSHPTVSRLLTSIDIMNTKFKLQGTSVAEVLKHLEKDIKSVVNNGDVQTLECLLKDGADANKKDINGRTALHFAISNGQTEMVKILLKNGADVFRVTNKGNSPLHLATSKNNSEITEILLKHVSYEKLYEFVNIKTTSRGTASLHVAAINGSFEIVNMLLKHGAIYNIQNIENKTPIDLARDLRVINLLKLIEELFEDAKTGEITRTDKLCGLKSGEFSAVMNARDKQGNTISEIKDRIRKKHF